MTITVPTLTGAVAHDDPETLIGTLSPSGGTPPYEIVAIWPASGALGDPDRIAIATWRDRQPRPAAVWRGRAVRPAATWRERQTRPEATWR